MRFLELSLVAYGSFSDLRLDFGEPRPALHLIYGANEAGKSTTLRAILGLLYGIDHQSPDAHLHGGPNLRIAARLCDEAGHELSVLRRKGKKDTLLGPDGRPVDEALLARMLGELSEPVFRSMFGLDHERLRQGGEQLRRGQGDLGESLFQAGVGGPDVHRVLATLAAEADELFKPKGQRPAINEAIKAYDEAKKRVRELTSHGDLYRAQEQELETAKRRSAELHAERHALLAEQSRLGRELRVLPALAKQSALRHARVEIGDVVLLPEDAPEQRRRTEQTLADSLTSAQHLRRNLDALTTRRGLLQVPQSLASLDPESVRSVRDRLGSHKKAALDLPQRRSELRLLQAEADAALRMFGNSVALAEVQKLRVDSATQARIGKLAGDASGLRERLATADRELRKANTKLLQARAELGVMPAPQHAEGSANASLQLPPDAALTAFRKRFERIERDQARHQELRATLDEREARMQLALDTMQHEGTPPTEDDLIQVRARREAAWQELRALLATQSGHAAQAIAPTHEALVQQSDELADRLRRELGRVSQLAALLAEGAAIGRERSRLADEAARLERETAAAEAEWRGLWEPLGVVPRPPADMQLLTAKVAALLEEGRRGRIEAEAAAVGLQSELASWQTEWAALMQRLSLRENAGVEEAQAVLQGLRGLFEKVDAIVALELRIEAMERDAQEFGADVSALLARHLPELAPLALEQAVEEFLVRYENAQRDLQERARIEQQLPALHAELLLLDERGAEASGRLGALLRAARVDSSEGLEHAEQLSARARQLDRNLAEVDAELLLLAEGAGMAALIEATAEQSPDTIRVRLHDIESDLERVNNEHATAVHTTGSLESALLAYLGNDQAAQAASEVEQHLSRIKAHVHSYARKRLAADLLQREVRRYRDANQGPIISRASELFVRLTLGRYVKLQVGYDDRDEAVLQCLSSDGRAVTAPELSDGTRDQLYLALRLATLERFARNNQPIPLVLDDVLIHFDDDRARAALIVLGELAGSMQVLFFTHHARLLDLARDALPRERLVEHRLTAHTVAN